MAVVAVDRLEFFTINEEQFHTTLLAEHLLQIVRGRLKDRCINTRAILLRFLDALGKTILHLTSIKNGCAGTLDDANASLTEFYFYCLPGMYACKREAFSLCSIKHEPNKPTHDYRTYKPIAIS